MTDRIKGLTVTLDEDYRVDDAEAIVNAIRQIRGVAHVALHVRDLDDHMARARVRGEIASGLLDLHRKILGTP